jgi:hypothetical protein
VQLSFLTEGSFCGALAVAAANIVARPMALTSSRV